MKTIRATIHVDFPVYDDLFRVYNSCLRYAYNRIVDNKGEFEFKTLYKDLYSKFLLSKRCIYNVISQANIRYYFHKDMNKNNGSSVCFGTAESFRQYNDGEISKDELKARRNRIIWASGEVGRDGNSSHYITKDKEGKYWIQSYTTRIKNDSVKPRSNKTDKYPIFIPKDYREEFDKCDKWTITILNSWLEKGYYEVRLAYGEDIDYLKHKNIISIDLNHNTLDYSIIKNKVRIETSKFELNLSGKRKSKQKALIDIIKNKLIPLAFKHKAHFVIENLTYFRTDKKSIGSKKARKKIGSISRQEFVNLMISIPKKLGIKTDLVAPQYTSYIAKQKYKNEFKNKDQGASYVIGRKRILGKKNYKTKAYDFYERLPKSLKLKALIIAVLLNVKRLSSSNFEKIKPKFTNFSLWWYLRNVNVTKLKDSLRDVNFESSCNGSFELVELVLHQIQNLVTLTESDKDFSSLNELLRKLLTSLRETRKDYTSKSGTGALQECVVLQQ